MIISVGLANSVDLDQTAPIGQEQSDLGLDCLCLRVCIDLKEQLTVALSAIVTAPYIHRIPQTSALRKMFLSKTKEALISLQISSTKSCDIQLNILFLLFKDYIKAKAEDQPDLKDT